MKTIPTLCLLVLGCFSLHAFEFRVVSWDGRISGLHYQNGGRAVEIAGEEKFLSQPYPLREAPAALELFREIERDGEKIRLAVASIPVPEGLSRGILMLAPADAHKTSYAGMWIDDSPETRPLNHIQVHNFSTKPVAIKTGGGDFLVSPKGWRQIAFDGQARSVPFKIAMQTASRWEVVSSRNQPVRDNYRILVILRDGRTLMELDGPVARPVEIVTLYDRAPVLTVSR